MKYAWHFDRLSGCGRFIRKADNGLTLWETGSDAQRINAQAARLSPDQLDAIAAEYEYF